MSAKANHRYRSFRAQTQHYFNRPHDSIPREPLTGPGIWRGADLRAKPERWEVQLSAQGAAEVVAAAKDTVAAGLSLSEVDSTPFRLPTVSQEVAQWRTRITAGPDQELPGHVRDYQ